MDKVINVRMLALETLVESEKKNIYVKDALNRTLFQNQFMSKQERAFLTRLVEGVTEYTIRLDYVVDLFSKTKIRKCKPVIRMILRLGVYQMLFMDSIPNEVACDECVKLAKKKGFQSLSGFVNGVLRSIARNIDAISYPTRDEDLALSLSIEYSMPKWIVDDLLKWYGNEIAISILEGSIATSDLTIRVSEDKISKNDLIYKLKEKEIEVLDGYYVDEALHLNNINYVLRIPGFKQGEFFIQDESSMLLYHAVENRLNTVLEKGLSSPLTILDLCSAPGGKATHFAQKLGKNAVVIARDLSEKKVSLIEENIARLGLTNMKASVHDALVFDQDMKNVADVVIADLPCSGLGIIGKKNDIKYRLNETQLKELATLQRDILKNAMQYVKPGGLLIFSTCTINPDENIANANWILDSNEFEPYSFKMYMDADLEQCFIKENMMQLLQGRQQCDGFFISVFSKKES